MIKKTFTIKLFDPEMNKECFVDFLDCEDADSPAEPIFSDPEMQFPYQYVRNYGGHLGIDNLCSPNDFLEKADAVGLDAEIFG